MTMQSDSPEHEALQVDEDPIRTLVSRLARPHPSGGKVIERAAILAEGGDFPAVMAWIEAHAGEAEAAPSAAGRGLHGGRLGNPTGSEPKLPLRFVLPASTLN